MRRRGFIACHRKAQRERGSRATVLSLPDVNDPGYRDRLADESRRLAQFMPEEDAIAADFARLWGRAIG